MPAISKSAMGIGLCVVLGLLVVRGTVEGAPKDKNPGPQPRAPLDLGPGAPKATGALQPLFDKSKRYPGIQGRMDEQNHSISYPVEIEKDLKITVQEMPNGYGWIWCPLAEFDKNPAFGMFKKMAESNDQSRTGYYLSWDQKRDKNGNPLQGGRLYLNCFFLIRTADTPAIENYINAAIDERTRCKKDLADYLQ